MTFKFPGARYELADFDPNACEDYENKKDVDKELEQQLERLKDLQQRLREHCHPRLISPTGEGKREHLILYPTPQGCGYNNKGCEGSLKNSSLDPDDSDNYFHKGSVTVAVTRGKVG